MAVGSIAVSAVTLGCTYALIGIGFVILFRTTRVLSFAQGFFSVLGALVFSSLLRDSLPYPAALVLAALLTAIVGPAVYVLLFRRFALHESLLISLATIGLGLSLEAIATMIWGPQTIVIPAILGYRTVGPSWFPVTPIALATIVVAALAYGAVVSLLYGTKLGLRMRAVANQPALAAALGVNLTGLSSLAWGLAAGTAALAGMVYVITVQPDPGTVYDLGLVAFPAILLGGLDSVPGALVGGLLIGLVQTIVVTYVGGSWQDVSAYLVLLAVLLVRPQGLFGDRELSRP